MAKHILTLKAGGGAELVEDGDVIWNSDDDESFRDDFPDEILSENDVAQVLDYLVDDDVITDEEADRVEIEEESVPGSIQPADDEDDEDDEDEDDDSDDDEED